MSKQLGMKTTFREGFYMDDLTKKNDCKATFTIQIQFQQNSTWQGTIAWAEGKKIQKFRSELEMLKLMMEAVSADEAEDERDVFNTWQ
jgi:hypothetical protein